MQNYIPKDGGRIFVNHWSNGDPFWTGKPPDSDTTMWVKYFRGYFNSSDPARIKKAEETCNAARAKGEVKLCSISGAALPSEPVQSSPNPVPVNGQSGASGSAGGYAPGENPMAPSGSGSKKPGPDKAGEQGSGQNQKTGDARSSKSRSNYWLQIALTMVVVAVTSFGV